MAQQPAPSFDRDPETPGAREIAALVERAQSGDRSALELLWRGHRRWAAAILMAHAPRREDSEDLLQEVALRVVRKIQDLRNPARFRGWLRTIALNVARSAGRRVARDPHERVEIEPSVEPIAGDDSETVLDAIEALPAEYREPLILRCVHGYSQREIASELELAETTVETRIARARRKIRERLSRCGLLPRNSGEA